MPRGQNNKRRKKRRSKFTGFVMGALLLLAAVVGFSVWWVYDLWQEIYLTVSPSDENSWETGDKEKERESLPDVLNVLLLGLDARDQSSARTDAIMVLSLHNSGEMSVVSIPRDMRVEVPGYGMDKINHAHAFGGVSLAQRAVEDFLDVNIDHYVTTDFEGFKNIIDILGGVEIDVERRMFYQGIDVTIDLQPGQQMLDGDKALQYVRWRSDGEGDFGRVRRQQKLVKVVANEFAKPTNLLKVPKLLPEVAKNVRTDLELNQALSLAGKLRNLDLDEINTLTVPGRPATINGISYVIPDEDKLGDIVERYINFSYS